MSRQIPDRWLPYKAFGNVIEGTRIICFKVPLRRIVQRSLPDKDVWDIETLLSSIPKIGAVIDLTNTSKYYNPEDLMSKGILYKKILMEGRRLPPEQAVNKFINAVDDFLNISNDSLVGVHCTHGLNRTGYMVCRYMRDRLGVPPREAIHRFEMARGYKIERNNYIAKILGDKPLPPDVGKDTIVKPIEPLENSNKTSYGSPKSDSSYEFDYKYDY